MSKPSSMRPKRRKIDNEAGIDLDSSTEDEEDVNHMSVEELCRKFLPALPRILKKLKKLETTIKIQNDEIADLKKKNSKYSIFKLVGMKKPEHPLLIPAVLECIFKNLDLSDIKTCRQVNSVWNETATVLMRNATCVYLESDPNKKPVEDKLLDFLELVQSEASTFSTLPIANNYYLSRIPLYNPAFWTICGSSIKSVQLSHISFDSAYIFHHAIFQSCPNLEKLDLCDVKVPGSVNVASQVFIEPRFSQNKNLKWLYFSSDIQLGSISFLELLSYFPSLEKINVNGVNGHAGSKIFNALATARAHDPQCWNVKEIGFRFNDLEEPESSLHFLLDDSLSLETFDAKDVKLLEHINIIWRILDSHATTLKRLRLHGEMAGLLLDKPYNTIFEKTTCLDLSSTTSMDLRSFNFLQKVPNLQNLNLSNCNCLPGNEFSEEPEKDWVLSSCTTLTLLMSKSNPHSEKLITLFKMLPNVEKLSVMFCDNMLFAGICKDFENLVCLSLTFSMVDDYGISGLDEEDVKRVNAEGRKHGWQKPITVQRPNLSSLKNLKWLSLDFIPRNRSSPGIGYCSGLYGILQLPQLKHLKVDRPANYFWNRVCEHYPWRDP